MPQLEKKPYTFDQFIAIRRYGAFNALTFSPDGAEIAYIVNTSGQYNLWRQSGDGGYPHQLTTYVDRSVVSASWSPDGEWIAYMADYQGDEFYQLFAIPAAGGVPIQITDVDQVWHQFTSKGWSSDGRYVGFNANDRDREAMDVLVWDRESGEIKRVQQGTEYYSFLNWAPNGRQLLSVEWRSATDQDLHLVDVESGTTKLLTEHEGEAKYLAGPWVPDGSGFYMLTDESREFMGLAYYELSAGTWKWIEAPDIDVEFVEGTPDGRFLAWVLNDQGYSTIVLRDLESGSDVPLPPLPEGVVVQLAFAPDGSKLGLMYMTPTHCAEIFVVDLSTNAVNQITNSMLGGIDEQDLVSPETIQFRSFDERDIPAYLYKPTMASSEAKAPVILSIHGGPEWQERPIYIYAGMYQYWLSRGIGVLAPNIRGSTGYGKSYQKLIHKDWGGGELQDIEAAVKYLHSLDWVDKERIAVFGGSFGGFATLSAVTRLPDYWAVAVDIVGPSNLVTLIKTGPPHWQRIDERVIGHPENDFDFLMSRSPVTYANQVKAPLFIIQGANDPRVPQNESDQFVEQLREQGIEVRYDIYEDEGHGFRKRSNELKAWRDTSDFLE
ncbi:MAG: S9 family peptidase, partial [Anaerolineales bacterium]